MSPHAVGEATPRDTHKGTYQASPAWVAARECLPGAVWDGKNVQRPKGPTAKGVTARIVGFWHIHSDPLCACSGSGPGQEVTHGFRIAKIMSRAVCTPQKLACRGCKAHPVPRARVKSKKSTSLRRGDARPLLKRALASPRSVLGRAEASGRAFRDALQSWFCTKCKLNGRSKRRF